MLNIVKRCTNCKLEFETSEFYKDKRTKDGLMSGCKTCHKKGVVRWIKQHPEKAKRWVKNWDINNAVRLKQINLTWVKTHLITLHGHICASCKLSTWLDNPIPLELHHKDGNRSNNTLNNLELNCLNCHSLTDNFRNRK